MVSLTRFFTQGWDDVGNLAHSVKRLNRDMPIGILVCLGLVLLNYIAPLLSIAAVLTPGEYSVSMYVETCSRLWQPLGYIMSADALAGIFGLGFVYLTTSSEAQAHCSTLGLYPKFVSRRTRIAKTPWLAMVIQAGFVAAATPFSSFEVSVEFQSWLYTLSVALITVSFLVIRWRSRRQKGRGPDEFRLPLPFPVIVLFTIPVFCLCSAVIGLSSLVTLISCSSAVCVLLLVSWVLHWRRILRPARLYNRLATEPPPEECPQVTASIEATGGQPEPEPGPEVVPAMSPGPVDTGPILLDGAEVVEGETPPLFIRARASLHVLAPGPGFVTDEAQAKGLPPSPPKDLDPALVLPRSSSSSPNTAQPDSVTLVVHEEEEDQEVKGKDPSKVPLLEGTKKKEEELLHKQQQQQPQGNPPAPEPQPQPPKLEPPKPTEPRATPPVAAASTVPSPPQATAPVDLAVVDQVKAPDGQMSATIDAVS